MNWWQMTVSAVVQGIAEFLPISSDGHLLIVQALMGANLDQLEVNVVLHAGTLGSIFVVYWRDLLRLLGRDCRVIPLLIVGTVPAAVCGLLLATFCKPIVESTLLGGTMLPLTGLIVLWIVRHDGSGQYSQLRLRDAFWIGLIQATALLPGISRSGTTILAGLAVGLKRPEAATFSFLLAIPAVMLASAYGALKLVLSGSVGTAWGVLAYGTLLTFVVGVAALWSLKRLLEGGHLRWFAWWCIVVGIAVTAWQVALLWNE